MSEVNIISTERLEKGTIRIMVQIKGHEFKRLYAPGYPVVWHDESGKYNGCQALKPKQEKELESIFKAWMLENNTDEQKLLAQ